MPDNVTLRINGQSVTVPAGTTLAAALAAVDQQRTRRSVSGQARGPLCGMGVCFECRVTINGRPHQRSCQRLCEDGMEVQTDD